MHAHARPPVPPPPASWWLEVAELIRAGAERTKRDWSWAELVQACRKIATKGGALAADVDDVAQEAVARALERDVPDPWRYALTVAWSITRKLRSTSSARDQVNVGQGVTRAMTGSVGYTETRPGTREARWESSVIPTCALRDAGLSTEADAHDVVAASEICTRLGADTCNELVRLGSMPSTGRTRVVLHRLRAAARKVLEEPPPDLKPGAPEKHDADSLTEARARFFSWGPTP